MANVIVTFLPKVQLKGTPFPMPLFGPASPTREDAQRRIDEAMTSGNFIDGKSEIVELRQTPRRGRRAR